MPEVARLSAGLDLPAHIALVFVPAGKPRMTPAVLHAAVVADPLWVGVGHFFTPPCILETVKQCSDLTKSQNKDTG